MKRTFPALWSCLILACSPGTEPSTADPPQVRQSGGGGSLPVVRLELGPSGGWGMEFEATFTRADGSSMVVPMDGRRLATEVSAGHWTVDVFGAGSWEDRCESGSCSASAELDVVPGHNDFVVSLTCETHCGTDTCVPPTPEDCVVPWVSGPPFDPTWACEDGDFGYRSVWTGHCTLATGEAFDMYTDHQVDSGVVRYYDEVTGELVAEMHSAGYGSVCLCRTRWFGRMIEPCATMTTAECPDTAP